MKTRMTPYTGLFRLYDGGTPADIIFTDARPPSSRPLGDDTAAPECFWVLLRKALADGGGISRRPSVSVMASGRFGQIWKVAEGWV
ncbi:hypothetical protein DVU_2346 [Nitratidesulfovibrio vulgaris str. Hildenborough]|uniref:Uncharacterized protein n=1 Tax=Nitratidesulfovibrio vulgaris (strain ATCC 29579 / DSM 644 / CCUG 34227 / NCIMB 8303 / VKM B-1760 / Hildenborough) TaxID=882 RepID=Q729K4_NITV2|nr:hypothetical protein DVU_2346 [Nitratidesulfovibrio vulgaris str. Hildenborough]